MTGDVWTHTGELVLWALLVVCVVVVVLEEAFRR